MKPKFLIFLLFAITSSILANLDDAIIKVKTFTYHHEGSQLIHFKLEFPDSDGDYEWLTGVSLDFPDGIEVLNGSQLEDANGSILICNNESGYGEKISWGNVDSISESGTIGADADFFVTIQPKAEFSGNMNVSWFLNGDNTGTAPHTLEGNLVVIERPEQGFLFTTKDSVVFTNTAISDTKKDSIYVKNIGNQKLTISSIDLPEGITMDSVVLPMDINKQEDAFLRINYTPTVSENLYEKINIKYGDDKFLTISCRAASYVSLESFVEDFEDNSFYNEDWQIKDFDHDGECFKVGDKSWLEEELIYDGEKSLCCQYCILPGESKNNDWLISPVLRVDSNSNLKFYIRSADNSYANENVNIRICDYQKGKDTSNYKIVKRLRGLEDSWTLESVDLNNYYGKNVRIAWQYVAVNQYQVLLDNISFSKSNSIDSYSIKKENLVSAYPNPFNPTTSIKFRIDNSQAVSLKIFNVRGELIKTQTRYCNRGLNSFKIHLNSSCSGIYFFKLLIGKSIHKGKLVLQK